MDIKLGIQTNLGAVFSSDTGCKEHITFRILLLSLYGFIRATLRTQVRSLMRYVSCGILDVCDESQTSEDQYHLITSL